MRSRRTLLLITIAAFVIVISVIIAATAAFNPSAEPQFETALAFARAIGQGDNEAARTLMSPDLREWVDANCPQGVATCISETIPDEWGNFLSVVFRRASPDQAAWDVDLIATYERDDGFSGVCIYTRMERDSAGAWQVAGFAGWIHCGDARSRNMATNPETPNRAP